MSNNTKVRRNAALWDHTLPKVREYLDANPLASCTDAAREFNLCSVTLGAHLRDEYDFKKRRAARGAKRRARVGDKEKAVRAALGMPTDTANDLLALRRAVDDLVNVAVEMLQLQDKTTRAIVAFSQALPDNLR